jgi:hypothetical protein
MGLDLRNVDGLEDIAIPLRYAVNRNRDGLQEAHIYGQDFSSRALGSEKLAEAGWALQHGQPNTESPLDARIAHAAREACGLQPFGGGEPAKRRQHNRRPRTENHPDIAASIRTIMASRVSS